MLCRVMIDTGVVRATAVHGVAHAEEVGLVMGGGDEAGYSTHGIRFANFLST